MSVPSTYVMPVGDLRRPLIGRAAFGTLLASAIFFVFTATKQSSPVYVHAPWVNDPYDTVFSFTMFFVPLLAATVLVQLSLCRKSEPLPTGRVVTILRGCRIALAAMAIELLSAWVSVALGANRSEWTASTAVLITLLILSEEPHPYPLQRRDGQGHRRRCSNSPSTKSRPCGGTRVRLARRFGQRCSAGEPLAWPTASSRTQRAGLDRSDRANQGPPSPGGGVCRDQCSFCRHGIWLAGDS